LWVADGSGEREWGAECGMADLGLQDAWRNYGWLWTLSERNPGFTWLYVSVDYSTPRRQDSGTGLASQPLAGSQGYRSGSLTPEIKAN